MSSLPPILTLLLLACPVVAGEVTWDGALAGPSVGGIDSIVDGSLRAVSLSFHNDSTSTGWSLRGDSLVVHEIHQDYALAVGTESSVTHEHAPWLRDTPLVPEGLVEDPLHPRPNLDYREDDHTEHGAFSATLDEVDQPGVLRVFFLERGSPPTFHLTSASVSGGRNSHDLYPKSSDSQLPNNPGVPHPMQVGVLKTQEFVQPAAPWSLAVSGDFLLEGLFQRWVVEDGDGTWAYAAGREVHDDVGGPDPAPEVGSGREQWLALEVRNGTLEIMDFPGVEVVLYAASVSSWSAAEMFLPDAVGVLDGIDGSLRLVEKNLWFSGPTDLVDVRTVDGRFDYRVSSSAEVLYINGAVVRASASHPPQAAGAGGRAPELGPETTASVPDTSDASWLGLVVILLLLSVIPLTLRPPFPVLLIAMHLRRHAYVVRHVPRFLPRPRVGPRAAVMGAVSLLALGRFEEAVAFLEALPEDRRPESPTWHYLCANARAGVGQTDEAVRHLAACLTEAPQYQAEVLGNLMLRRLIESDPAALLSLMPGRVSEGYA